jgi:hypothetical protein
MAQPLGDVRPALGGCRCDGRMAESQIQLRSIQKALRFCLGKTELRLRVTTHGVNHVQNARISRAKTAAREIKGSISLATRFKHVVFRALFCVALPTIRISCSMEVAFRMRGLGFPERRDWLNSNSTLWERANWERAGARARAEMLIELSWA